ncbi:MAG: hypothetical protein ABWY12_09670 [Burkholderiales bacterium]
MKRLLPLLLLGVSLSAQPVIVAGPTLNPHDLSHSTGRVMMVTDVNARRNVEFGRTATPDANWRRRFPEGSSLYTKHEWFIDGLAGSTQYWWRMCVGLDTVTSGITMQVSPANTVTRTAHGYVAGDLIMFSAGISAGKPDGTLYSLGNNVTYFVINPTANTFQLALTAGGAVVPITGSLGGSIRMGKASCSAVQTFTTPADGAVHPNPPAAVTVTAPNTSPTITGTTYVADANCAVSGVDFQTFLSTTIAGLTGSANVAVTFPDAADCRGAFTFPPRSHTGLVVFKPASAAAHPPQGVRTTEPFRAAKPKFTNNLAPVANRSSTTGVFANTESLPCEGTGEIHMANVTTQYNVDAPGISNLYNCVSTTSSKVAKTITAIAGTTLTAASFTVPAHGWDSNQGYMVFFSGTGVSLLDNVAFPLLVVDANTLKIHTTATNVVTPCSSGTCGTITIRLNKVPLSDSFGAIADRPAEPCTNGKLWSVMDVAAPLETTPLNTVDICRDNAWVRLRYAFGGANAASIPAMSVTGNGYRFENIELRFERWPAEVASLYGDWGTGGQEQGEVASLINTPATVSNITWDRCDIHSYDFPNRISSPINVGGTGVSIINSRVHDMVSWQEFPYPALNEVNGIQVMQVKDFVLRNNYLSSVGITVYVHPSPGQSTDYTQIHKPQANMLIQRNHFEKKAIWQTGTAENASGNANRAYVNRHHFEFKSGGQALLDGNILTRNWGDTTQGSPILQTPTGNSGIWISSPISNITNGVITYTTATYLDLLNPPGDPPVMVAVYATGNPALHGIYTITANNAAANTITVSGMAAGSTTSGTVTVMGSSSEVSDVMISNNTIRQAAVGTYSNAYNTAQAGFMLTKSKRVWWVNNWFNDLNRRGCKYPPGTGVCDITDGPPYGYYAGTGSQSNGKDGYVWSAFGHGEDFVFANNTASNVDGLGMSMMDFQYWKYQNGEGMVIKNNVFSTVPVVVEGPVNGITTDAPAGMFGGDALDGTFPDRLGTAAKGWQARNNVLPSASTNAAKYTGIATLTSLTDLRYAQQPALRWDSPHKSGGGLPADDMRDAGVNVKQLQIAQGEVDNARVRSTSATPISASSTSAIVSYIAPDAEACELRVSTTAWGLGTPVSDGGGARSRNVTVTLTAGTTDQIALLCAVQQYSCPERGGHCTLIPE